MHEAVSDILIERARVDDGLSKMFAVSLTVHGALLALAVLAPAGWWSSASRAETPPPMMISIGGTEGPSTPGRTISERPVQSVAAPEEKAPDSAPAPKAPEMVEPERTAKPAPRTKPTEKPADKTPGRKPTAGEEIKSGSANVKTGGAHIPFGGLAHAGGGGTDGVRLDVQNFCCPEYIKTMVQRIRQSWNSNQGAPGEVWVKFTIRRDGMLTLVEVEKSSGQAMLDLESRRAVLMTRQLPPLPREFTEPHLTVHLAFDYKR